MYFNTAFNYGDINEILDSSNYSDSIKFFASISSCDNSGILNYSEILRTKENIDEQCLIKILIFTAAINLVSKNRGMCVEILNKLGPPSFDKVIGWQQSFFYSTWQLLMLHLKIKPNNYKLINAKKLHDKKLIIGDSHLFGMIPGLINNSDYLFVYIPGLRYSLLSSPQDNLKKTAIRNALAIMYEMDNIIISIGEIDTRSFLIDAFNDREYSKKNSISYFKNIFSDSLNYIQKNISHNQELFIIIPPPPFKIINNIENKSKLNQIIKSYLDIIIELKNILILKKIKFIEYPSNIIDADGFVDQNYLIDHAHFNQDIYMKLLGFEPILPIQVS